MSDFQKRLAKFSSAEKAKQHNDDYDADEAKEALRVEGLTDSQIAEEEAAKLEDLKEATQFNINTAKIFSKKVARTRTELYADEIAKARRQGNTEKVKELEKGRDDSIQRGRDSWQKDIKNGEATIRDLDKKIEALLNPIFTTADQQALLLYNLDKFSAGYKGSPKYYGEALGNPVLARSHIFSPKGVDKFLNISNDLLSSLIPKVKLYKVESGKQIEYVFDSHQDPNVMTASSQGRGTGAGIKSVSIDNNNDTAETADSRVGVKISLYFSSLEEIFIDRGGYKYADLVTPRINQKHPDGSPHHEPVRLNVGYSIPIGGLWERQDDLKEVLKSSERGYYLLYQQHKIDFKDNGAISLDIEFSGYIEKKTLHTDIFELTMTPEEVKQLRKAQDEILNEPKKSAQTNPVDAAAEKAAAEKREERVKILKQLNAEKRSNAYSAFLSKMFEDEKVHRLSFKRSEISGLRLLKDIKTEFIEPSGIPKAVRKRPTNLEVQKAVGGGMLAQAIASAMDYFAADPEVKKKPGAIENGQNYEVEYFYLGDFLDRMFELVKKDRSFKKTDFVFGTIPYRMPSSGDVKSIEISKIPISMSSFTSWFIENVVKKGERTNYNVRDFIYDVLNNLVAGIFRSAVFTSEEAGAYGAGVLVPVFHTGIFNTKVSYQGFKGNYTGIKPTPSPMGNSQFYTNYLVYATNSQLELNNGQGIEADDAKKGIYHLVAAREKGLVKRIKFERSQQKYIREDMMISGGASKPGEVFRDIYNANVELFGNPVFIPGMQVYIKTLSYELEYAKQLQIIGYYRIIKTSSVIENGKYRTDVECKWEYLGP